MKRGFKRLRSIVSQLACAMVAVAVVTPAVAQSQDKPALAQAREFAHPGVLFTRADLELLKANIDSNREPWKSGYAALAAEGRSQLGYKMGGPFANVSRAPNVNLWPWRSDMVAIWNLSRMWYFTGNEEYAQKAHDILLAWATTHTSFTGRECMLDLGDYACALVGGADILRGTWPGWTEADTTAVKAYFGNVLLPATNPYGESQFGAANKGALALAAGGLLAIFNDDTATVNRIVYQVRTLAHIGLRSSNELGMLGDSLRDQGHAHGQLVSLAVLAEALWKQGIDIHSDYDNRLLTAGEYFARVNDLVPTPFLPFGTTDAYYTADKTNRGWGGGNVALNLIHGAYVVRKGLSAPYIVQRRRALPVDGNSFMFIKETDTSVATPPPPVSIPTTTSITTGFSSADIGGAYPAGGAAYADGAWTVRGGGSEIWKSNDSCHFTYKEITGDCAIVAKVESVENTSPAARAGVMMRTSLTQGTPRAWMAITASGNLEQNMPLLEVYGGTNYGNKVLARSLPSYWVKLERIGNIITGYVSPDGTNWAATNVGRINAPVPEKLYVGLVVCSAADGKLNSSTFSNVQITGGDGRAPVVTPAAPAAVLASPENGAVPLRWQPSFGAAGYTIRRATTSGGPYSTVASGIAIATYTDTTVTNGTTYYYVVSASNSAGTSDNSPEESTTPTRPMVNAAVDGTATASASGSPASEGPHNAFDGRVGSRWFNGNAAPTGWIQYDFGDGITPTVQRYSVASAFDVPGRDPKDWEFQGSNDGSTWTTLDTQNDQTFHRLQMKTYRVAKPAAHRYYRLNITANNGDPKGMHVSELSLLVEKDRAEAGRTSGASLTPHDVLFPLSAVRLLDGPFTRAVEANRAYMLALDADRLLAPFRREAGQEPKKPPYPNWESGGLDGHTAGHFLAALADMIAAGHDTKDGELRRRLEYMISEMELVQQANGNGYIGGVPGSREFWQKIAAGQVGEVRKKWVPWYNVHKTFAGLRAAYLSAGNTKARDLLIRFGDWAVNVTSGLSDTQMQQMLDVEYGGMNEVLADICAITGDKKYLETARRFNHKAVLDPLERKEDRLTGLHANTQIPKVIGVERIATLTGDKNASAGARFFWETVTSRRSVVFGGNSVAEHFNDPKDFRRLLEHREGPETCNTYNMLRLTEQLFSSGPKTDYADYYERALYNHILASINPSHPGYVYFTPIRPGHYRVYSQPDQCFWCCVGTGMENPGRYGQFIYARAQDGYYVNLFIASELSVPGTGMTLRQETAFPDEERTCLTLKLDRPTTFTLYARHPQWVASGALAVKVNGQPVPVTSTPSSYAALRREWHDGDRVEIALPMRTTVEGLPDGSSWYAILHGPIVLATPTGTENQVGLRAGAGRGDHIAHGPLIPLDKMPALGTSPAELPKHIVPDPAAGPLHFRIMDVADPASPQGLLLTPFFRLQDSRYQMYWEVVTKEDLAARSERLAVEERAKVARDAATLDAVAVGEQQPEVDHELAGEGMESGVAAGRRWRHGKQFQYTLDTHGEKAVDLVVTYWGGDNGRTFDIFANDTLIATQELKAEKPGQFLDKRYPIPAEVLASARDNRVTAKFIAKVRLAGGIFDVRLMRPNTPAPQPAAAPGKGNP